ncbi:MAG: hypothetical protein GC162_15505 [Planctomycetes bacterium]|nr:hypothetical protein [Planctomycetota bacterium]
MRQVQRTFIVASLFALPFMGGTPVIGATVGYWRFEGAATVTAGANNDFLDDYSGNGLALSTAGTPTVTQYNLPGSGTGSKYPNPVPSGSQSNTKAATFPNGGYLAVADAPILTVHDFTAEAFITKTANTSGTQYIASQWLVSGNQRSWSFGVAGTSDISGNPGSANDLFIGLSDAGSDAGVVVSGIDIALNKDYYVAVSFDESNFASGVTFYIQNLTDGGPLQVVTKSHTIASLFDSNTFLRIGTFNGSSSPWNGAIDEVRLSNTVLTASQLLIVPTPTALPAGLGLLGLFSLRRRHG